MTMFGMIPPTMLGGFNEPPTLYSILESIVNYGTDDKKRIKDLAKYGRTKIFDFSYPLTSKINKEDFECMILNHFLMRRIGFDVFLPFQIALNVKLNEIMPYYNKMFEMLDGWEIFKDGEEMSRTLTENREKETTTNTTSENTTNTQTSSLTNGENIEDKRSSDTPQNALSDVQAGTYVDNYEYNHDYSESEDESSSEASSNTNAQSSENGTENNSITEIIKRSPAEKMRLYTEFIENKNHIYRMIFKELEPLFYGLV